MLHPLYLGNHVFAKKVAWMNKVLEFNLLTSGIFIFEQLCDCPKVNNDRWSWKIHYNTVMQCRLWVSRLRLAWVIYVQNFEGKLIDFLWEYPRVRTKELWSDHWCFYLMHTLRLSWHIGLVGRFGENEKVGDYQLLPTPLDPERVLIEKL